MLGKSKENKEKKPTVEELQKEVEEVKQEVEEEVTEKEEGYVLPELTNYDCYTTDKKMDVMMQHMVYLILNINKIQAEIRNLRKDIAG